jgi:beta-N-acetylhexosaminidase
MRQPIASLSQKVGQVFMVGFEGTEVTPELAAWLRRFAWGGVILFGRNVVAPAQLAALTQGLQAVAGDGAAPPLLIAVDQEGGRVARLKAPFTSFPSAATVGRTGSEASAFDIGAALGRELSAVGINMDMAPVLDVLANPANTVIGDRAFGDDPRCVARLAVAWLRGLHSAGVLAVGKHFPGHGATAVDSHVALPVAERTLAQLEACELVPFRDALAAGVAAIMTAHVLYPAWDGGHPATLSPAILTGLLRRRLGFRGAIITDDLGMAGVAAAYPPQDIPVQALRAGADLLLLCHHRQRQEEAYGRVLRAVQSGELPEAIVDRAVARIQQLKRRWRRLRAGVHAPATLDGIGSPSHQKIVEAVRARAHERAGIERANDE